ncbi:amidohydrolase family protein [Pseudoalteromonas sp. SCSIO 43201]|uniref:amidohydrolase family protein n=1 Tax=Pseudoalteromonas TaxID=53246 RepID=UPI0020763B0A|nr:MULTISPECIES: amidohydrolase family protein [Pseudoalteromonas]MDW7549321.1 amidohydrolase family protein [Pseudoalteromonas peptidolytica]USD28981.1 amidohydrolase family protein [Pseudoalteromonas sp. SCSIO 43201]
MTKTIIKKRTLSLLVASALAAQSWAALAETITNNVYSEKGLAGTLTQEKIDDQNYKAKIEFGWNNRRILIDENLTLNEQGLPIKLSLQGRSAFGSKIDETFSYNRGIAQWKSVNESGIKADATLDFYVPSNLHLALDNATMRYVLKNNQYELDVYPQGKMLIEKLKTLKLGEQTVHLLVTSGLSLTPNFAWYDDDGNYFAQTWGAMYVLRDGFSKAQFEQLETIQKQAEQQHLENLAKKLTHQVPELFIENVAVFDSEQKKLLKKQDVLIQDGKIVEVANHIKKPKGVASIDGKGKTLIPGLWDMHGHLSKENGILNIANGVTSVRDMGNEHDNIMEIEALFNTNQVLGSRVYRAGFMDKYSENSAGLSVKSLQEALDTIDFFADNGYVQVKLYSSIDPSWVKPISERAHSRGLRLSGHVPAFMTAEQAIANGYDEIQHINMLFLNFLAGEEVDTRTQKRFSLMGEQASGLSLDSPEMNAFIKLLSDKKVVVDPTVSTFRSLLMSEDQKVNPEFAAISEHMPIAFARGLKGAEMHVDEQFKLSYQESGEAMQKMLKKLYDAGVPMVPGTDNIAGFTLIRELELYVDAGIPAAEVLNMASIESAKLMGVAHQTGSIAKGKVADLVLVDGDPLKDITALQKAALVIKGEQAFKPAEIYRAIGVKPFTSAPSLK